MLRRCVYLKGAGLSCELPFTAQRLLTIDKLLRLRYTLETRTQFAMSRAEFDTLTDKYGMTPQEGQKALEAFHEAGVVLLGAEGTIISDVRKGLEHYHSALGKEAPCASVLLARRKALLQRELDILNVRKHDVDRMIATQWARFWAAVAVGSAAQMLGLCYLTFVAFDWDLMEPVCYFVTTGTIIVFFAFMMRFKKEHSIRVWDTCVLPKYVEDFYSNSNFDIRRWLELNHEIKALNDQIQKVKGPNTTTIIT